jgi:hypothetical protein
VAVSALTCLSFRACLSFVLDFQTASATASLHFGIPTLRHSDIPTPRPFSSRSDRGPCFSLPPVLRRLFQRTLHSKTPRFSLRAGIITRTEKNGNSYGDRVTNPLNTPTSTLNEKIRKCYGEPVRPNSIQPDPLRNRRRRRRCCCCCCCFNHNPSTRHPANPPPRQNVFTVPRCCVLLWIIPSTAPPREHDFPFFVLSW